jgi:hypothetical protein
VVLRLQAKFINYGGPAARTTLQRVKLLSSEIDILAPAVTRNGQRPDNCEYPWEDAGAELHVPLVWTFIPSDLLLQHAGRSALKPIVGAIERFVESVSGRRQAHFRDLILAKFAQLRHVTEPARACEKPPRSRP